MIFSFSVSFSVGAEKWQYKRSHVRQNIKHAPKAQTNSPRKHLSHPSQQRKASKAQTRSENNKSTDIQRLHTHRKPISPDTGFSTLSAEAQELQRHTRESHRERKADMESLRLLMEATKAVKARRKRYLQRKDAHSLKVLEDAATGGAKQSELAVFVEREVETRESSGLGGSWCSVDVVGSRDGGSSKGVVSGKSDEIGLNPSGSEDVRSGVDVGSSTDFCKVLDLDAVAGAVEVLKQRRTPSPEPLSDRDIEPRLLFRRSSTSEQQRVHSADGVQSPHSYVRDPFGSVLVEDGAAKEARLRESMRQYRQEQVESVHTIFRSLKAKDAKKGGGLLRITGDDSSPSSGDAGSSPEAGGDAIDEGNLAANGEQLGGRDTTDEDWLLV